MFPLILAPPDRTKEGAEGSLGNGDAKDGEKLPKNPSNDANLIHPNLE